MNLVVAPFDAPGCLGRVGSRRSDPATAIAERVAFGRVPDKIGRQKGRADPSKAGKRDNQIQRARVLEVRIHLPPPKSQRTFSPLQLNDPGRGVFTLGLPVFRWVA